jgi:bifunctional non-homologous end joining protein LigD
VSSFLFDGEAVILRDDGVYDFNVLRSSGHGGEVILVAFRPERNGVDVRKRPLLARKQLLAQLVGKAKTWSAIQYGDHLIGDGPAIFAYVCRLGLEGIVSKRTDAPYRSGPSKTWVKTKNPASETVRREDDEELR